MGTRVQTILMTLVYAGLAISLTGVLSTALIENFPHQIFGISFFALLICHLILNRFWIRHSLTGRWDLQRAILMIVDVALAILSIAQVVNCVLLSSFFWSLLPQDVAFFSSSLHMCIGTWIFVLAALHLGLNANALIGNRLHFHRTGMGKLLRTKGNVALLVVWVALAAVGAYGVFEFFQLGMGQYMLMLDGARVESGIALIGRFAQYLCVGIAIAEITHCVSVSQQNRKRGCSTAQEK